MEGHRRERGAGQRPGAARRGRVLDLSGPIGAYCTRLLSDLGADVVLVEPPEGDRLRRLPPFDDDDPARPLLFAWYRVAAECGRCAR